MQFLHLMFTELKKFQYTEFIMNFSLRSLHHIWIRMSHWRWRNQR